MIIDGKNLIIGRMATIVAKKALMGEEIIIVNCEQMIISGSKKMVFTHYKERRERGDPHHGPKYPKQPDRIIRRAIRGMLPYKDERGRKAFERVKCYIGLPENLKNLKLETIKSAEASRLKTLKQQKIGEIASQI
ncbi:MAG TPA: 50S ribosomal protein L13 [Candidatus Nanoarchaeia archaeon]|nr:50S ribosomal protein L13 [Candidatus Nanoarchaeia archaeon]